VLNWIAGQVAGSRQPYCYRESYGRGVGVPLSTCRPDQSKSGLLCYPPCKDRYHGVGPVCWEECPSGYVDTGALCHINKALMVEPSWSCQHRKWGICWWYGPDCPSGYTNIGVACALNTPSVPAGYKGLTGLDIMKGSYGRGVGTPMICKPGQDEDAGLCYTPCKAGFHGIGPVCWQSCPSGLTACGAGCANSVTSCVSDTASMVLSPAMMVADLVSLGGASGATDAANGAKLGATEAGTLTSTYKEIKAAVSEFNAAYQTEIAAGKAIYKAGSVTYKLGELTDRWATDYVGNFAKVTTPEVASSLDKAFQGHPAAENWVKKQYALQNLHLMMKNDLGDTATTALSVASSFDPTGVSGVVSAFLNPVCATPEAFPNVRILR
jgi:hypothetical protein